MLHSSLLCCIHLCYASFTSALPRSSFSVLLCSPLLCFIHLCYASFISALLCSPLLCLVHLCSAVFTTAIMLRSHLLCCHSVHFCYASFISAMLHSPQSLLCCVHLCYASFTTDCSAVFTSAMLHSPLFCCVHFCYASFSDTSVQLCSPLFHCVYLCSASFTSAILRSPLLSFIYLCFASFMITSIPFNFFTSLLSTTCFIVALALQTLLRSLAHNLLETTLYSYIHLMPYASWWCLNEQWTNKYGCCVSRVLCQTSIFNYSQHSPLIENFFFWHTLTNWIPTNYTLTFTRNSIDNLKLQTTSIT